MPTYRSGNINKDGKPKLTPYKVIQKFIISCGLKFDNDLPVYYSWESKRQPEWIKLNDGSMAPSESYLTLDYDKDKREWYVGYIVSVEHRFFATIDDVTGRCDLMTT